MHLFNSDSKGNIQWPLQQLDPEASRASAPKNKVGPFQKTPTAEEAEIAIDRARRLLGLPSHDVPAGPLPWWAG